MHKEALKDAFHDVFIASTLTPFKQEIQDMYYSFLEKITMLPPGSPKKAEIVESAREWAQTALRIIQTWKQEGSNIRINSRYLEQKFESAREHQEAEALRDNSKPRKLKKLTFS